jgi:hypothetical protein
MKHSAYYLLLILLLSLCTGCHPENYVRVEFKDSTTGKFLLQSFTDSSIRLLDYVNDSIHVVPVRNIRKFELHGDEIDLYSDKGKARLEKSLELKILW